jgi:hypothetical protein
VPALGLKPKDEYEAATSPAKLRLLSRRSRKSGYEIGGFWLSVLGSAVLIVTTRSGATTGSGRSRSASAKLNIADVAPMPRAREAIATIVKPGSLRSTRNACLMGSHMVTLLVGLDHRTRPAIQVPRRRNNCNNILSY